MAGKPTVEVEIRGVDRASPVLDQVSSKIGGLGTIITGLGIAGAITGVAMAVKEVGMQSIQTNAQLETATLQFETLLGSADAAKKHIQDLYEFAAKTPFETQPILNASKALLTFGGQALDTMENLKRVGDAAAVTGQSIDEVAFWFGRAYSAIMAGKPFGEAAARLQEMGILTADTRARLEALREAGASSAEIWAALTSSFDRFNGAMEKQANTMDGLISTIKDNINLFLGTALMPLFAGVKQVATALAEMVQSEQFTAFAERVSAALEPMISKFIEEAMAIGERLMPALEPLMEAFLELGETVGPVVVDMILSIIGVVADLLSTLMPLISALLPQLGALLAVILPVVTQLLQSILQPLLPVISQLISLAMPIISAILPVIVSILQTALPILTALLNLALIPITQALKGLQIALALLQQVLVPVINLIMGGLKQALDAIKGPIEAVARAVDNLRSKFANLKLPKWLTPGSPTPLELGLRGIAVAFKDLQSLPLTFPVSVSGIDEGISPAPRSLQVVINYQPLLSTADELEVQTRLAPVIYRAIRNYQAGVV